MPYLEIRLGPDTLLLRFVGRIDFVFGRLPKADIQLRDMKVSRLHTQVFIDSHGSAFVRDLGSSGGTGYNNKKLPKGVIAPLVDGVKVRVGDARVIYYDAEPPVNAIDPPGVSEPRGLIRTNERPRMFEADATVIAMDKVSQETANGPAEAPPIVKPEDFTEDGRVAAPSQKQPAAPPAPKKRRDTGIVEAPWEKEDSGIQVAPSEMVDGAASRSGQQKPGTRKIVGAIKQPELPADGVNPVAPTAAIKPASPDKLSGDERPLPSPLPPSQVESAAFTPPPPPPKKRDTAESGGMPTVSLGDALRTEPESSESDEDPLTDTQISNYLGGGESGDFDTIDFGASDDSTQAEPDSGEKKTDEIAFGPGAGMDDDEFVVDIDLDEEDVPNYDDAGTPPPTNDRGATDERAFKPRKTRKLMKRRTGKITDKAVTPLPMGAKTEAIPAPAANTLFIPKPIGLLQPKSSSSDAAVEKATGKPKAIAENREQGEKIDDMGAGPGGDTVAMDMDMLADMRKQLEAGEAIEHLGDSETIRTAPDDHDLDDSIEDSDIPDVSSSSGRHSGDFQEEAESLPEEKKADESSDPDTITD